MVELLNTGRVSKVAYPPPIGERKTMDHQAFAQLLGNYGEFLGAIAVVVTLGYLAAQIRQNTRSVRASSFQSGVDGINLLNNLLAQDESLARIFRTGNERLGSLTEDERVRYGFLYLSAFRSFESMYFHYLHGTGTELWGTHKEHISVLLTNPGVQEWWKNNPLTFTPEFSQFVEQRL
jgi:hypothetical protein